jgi:very-short-patch-repair endonuclease
MSKGEEHLIRILRAANIKFEREKTFSDLRGGKFRYDFYLPFYNILIEVDGEQHFKQVKKFQKTRKDFLHQQENDRRKNSYALANRITLIRIPYWEIENIKNYSDLFQKKFIVTTKWHNDFLAPKK